MSDTEFAPLVRRVNTFETFIFAEMRLTQTIRHFSKTFFSRSLVSNLEGTAEGL